MKSKEYIYSFLWGILISVVFIFYYLDGVIKLDYFIMVLGLIGFFIGVIFYLIRRKHSKNKFILSMILISIIFIYISIIGSVLGPSSASFTKHIFWYSIFYLLFATFTIWISGKIDVAVGRMDADRRKIVSIFVYFGQIAITSIIFMVFTIISGINFGGLN